MSWGIGIGNADATTSVSMGITDGIDSNVGAFSNGVYSPATGDNYVVYPFEDGNDFTLEGKYTFTLPTEQIQNQTEANVKDPKSAGVYAYMSGVAIGTDALSVSMKPLMVFLIFFLTYIFIKRMV